MSYPAIAPSMGGIDDMPPSTALKVLGLWDTNRRQRVQVFIKNTVSLCSGIEDLQNRILAYVAGLASDVPTKYRDAVLYAAARKVAAAVQLNLNLATINEDAADGMWLTAMKSSPHQSIADMPVFMNAVHARADDMDLFNADEPTHLALSPMVHAAAPEPINPLFDWDGAQAADISPAQQQEWLLQQPVFPLPVANARAPAANMEAAAQLHQQVVHHADLAHPQHGNNQGYYAAFPGVTLPRTGFMLDELIDLGEHMNDGEYWPLPDN
jgi:hypothetical protein